MPKYWILAMRESGRMKMSLPQQIKAHGPVLVNAGSLIGSTVVTSGLGFVYWWMATWQFSAEAIGLGSAAIQAMTLLGTLGLFGLGTLLVGELPRQADKEISLISSALLTVSLIGGCIGIIFALLAPTLSVNFQILRANMANILLFAVGVSLTASTSVFDQAMIGLLRGTFQLWRNIVFAIMKLVVLLLVGYWQFHKTGLTVYTTWTIGNGGSLLLLASLWLLRGRKAKAKCGLQWGWLRKLGPSALQHHILDLTLQTPALALPVIVTITLSAATNGSFYIAWMIISMIAIVPLALTMALYATASAQPAMLAQKMRLTLALAIATGLLANVILWFGAGQILRIFGHAYTEQAVVSLRILGFGIFPAIIINHFVTVCRLRYRMLKIVFPMLIGCLFELSAAALGAHFGGLAGLSLWWIIARYIESGFMLRTVCNAVWPLSTQVKNAGVQKATGSLAGFGTRWFQKHLPFRGS